MNTRTSHKGAISVRPIMTTIDAGPSGERGSEPQLAELILEDGTVMRGRSFGAPTSAAGEVVFSTGMVGYPETLTDPSFCGQILVCTYPLIGNYGVPGARIENGLDRAIESDGIHVKGLIVGDYSDRYSHWQADRSLGDWLRTEGIPAITGIDTRSLTKRLRERGTMLGKIIAPGQPIDFYDPNIESLGPVVSVDQPRTYGTGSKRIALLDCGAKYNIIHSLLARGLEVVRIPWDADLSNERFDGLMISNGPGNPRFFQKTVAQIRSALNAGTPTFGICLGHQLLALAAGASTYKLKYGHRSQNQPVLAIGTNRCFLTSQNHGFAVDPNTLGPDWQASFINLNDDTNEGLRHTSKPFFSVQFHPEACPGPTDTDFLFDEFARMLFQ